MKIPEFIIFTKKERAIILVLSTILIMVYVGNILIKPKVLNNEQSISLSEILQHDTKYDKEKSIANANSVLDLVTKKKEERQEKYKKGKWEKPIIKLSEFDPNTIDSLKWVSLGVHRYSVSKILKYRSKGGQFRKCEDLYRIYGIDSNYISTLLPYCKITERKTSNKKPYANKYKKKKWKKPIVKLSEFDPNTIDSLRWVSLGVHRYSVSKILRYRSKGGEFRTCEDIYRIYGIDSSYVTQLLPYCKIDDSKLSQKKSYLRTECIDLIELT